MAADFFNLPEDVRELLVVVDSFERLELLCRIASGPATTWWSLDELSGPLSMSRDLLEDPARSLLMAGFLVRREDGRYQLAPLSPRTAAAVASLAKLYEDDKVLIVRAITQLSMERLRSSAARTFADAFVFRRNKPEVPE